MFKKVSILFVPPLVVLGVLLGIYQSNSKYTVFPENTDFSVRAYSDFSQNGNSTIHQFKVLDKKILFHFTLASKIDEPFVGITFDVHNKFEDFSSYDMFYIKLKATNPRFRVNMKYHIEGLSKHGLSVTNLFSEVWAAASSSLKEYRIPLTDFTIPQWWYNFSRTPLSYDDAADLRFFTGLDIVVTDKITIGSDQKMEIEEVAFLMNPLPFAVGWGVFAVIYSLVICLSVFPGIKRLPDLSLGASIVESNQHPPEEDYIRLVDFFRQHFTDPELSLEVINGELGFSPKKVNRLLKKYHQTSFKKYLNTLRIEEARELLRTTALSVSEIGYRLGYNNPSHFCRIFKELEGRPPSECRE